MYVRSFRFHPPLIQPIPIQVRSEILLTFLRFIVALNFTTTTPARFVFNLLNDWAVLLMLLVWLTKASYLQINFQTAETGVCLS